MVLATNSCRNIVLILQVNSIELWQRVLWIIFLFIRFTEHRRIVYVGRIESETTKDDLRRIFSVYGRVENVTIHYKE